MRQIEPAVIDDAMLRAAVQSQGPIGEAGKIAKQEGIPYKTVKQLRLDSLNILKIENLWQFTSLTKLQMDSNMIEKIEGVDILVNLKWLDLSFNSISKIEGLDNLKYLSDLSFSYNRISRIEGLDSLVNLQTLSLAHNKLEVKEDIFYLRPFNFPKLRSVALWGNPLADDEEHYPDFPLALLNTLSYLDFKLIEKEKREKALEIFEIRVKELEHKEEKLMKIKIKEEKEQFELNQRQNAFVDHLNNLAEKMYEEDTDGKILNGIDTIAEDVENFKNLITELCEQIIQEGLNRLTKRTKESDGLISSMTEGIQKSNLKGAELIENLNKLIEDNFQSDDLSVKISELEEALMELEVTLNESNDLAIGEFEREYTDMIESFKEYSSGIFQKIRDAETLHHEKLQEECQNQLEKFIKNEVPDEYTEELKMLFVDKDAIQNALASSHDCHGLAIDTAEDALKGNSDSHKLKLIKKLQEEELNRSRGRYKEIAHLLDHYREELFSLEE